MHRPLPAFALIAILLLIVVLAPMPWQGQWVKTLHDFAHAPVFGCIAILALLALRSHHRLDQLSVRAQYSLALLVTVLLGLATEAAQIPAGGDSSWLDVRSDAVGAVAFLALFAIRDSRVTDRPIRVIAALAGVSLLIFHMAPVVVAATSYARRDEVFPVLADYTERMDTYFVIPQWAHLYHEAMPGEWATRADERALRVDLFPGRWPGLAFVEPVADWRGFKQLVLDITNPAAMPLMLLISVQDGPDQNRFEDRFFRQLSVQPRTRATLRIPLTESPSGPQTRALDLQHVGTLHVLSARGSVAGRMYVSRIWLE